MKEVVGEITIKFCHLIDQLARANDIFDVDAISAAKLQLETIDGETVTLDFVEIIKAKVEDVFGENEKIASRETDDSDIA
ncbi:hypothetical protein P4571_08300 [Niallia alba]|uniref:hypothetical protein n=1 Tax=Niallia alba TaxID=2729105 RepID=UPI002E22A18A|nr:hypothetical protein [Niallia alba]